MGWFSLDFLNENCFLNGDRAKKHIKKASQLTEAVVSISKQGIPSLPLHRLIQGTFQNYLFETYNLESS